MNCHIEAHDIHLEFYSIFLEHKKAISHWKAFLESVKEKEKSDKLELHLDEAAVRKLITMELNRSKIWTMT